MYETSIKEDDKLKGHIYKVSSLSKQQNFTVNDESHPEKHMVVNRKKIEIIGKALINIKILPYVSDESKLNEIGVYLHYESKTSCESNKQLFYQSIVLIYCDKESAMKEPKFIGSVGCIYYFIFYTDLICLNCLKSEVDEISSSCINGQKRKYFKLGRNCILHDDLKEKLSMNLILDQKFIYEQYEIITEDDLSSDKYPELSIFYQHYHLFNHGSNEKRTVADKVYSNKVRTFSPKDKISNSSDFSINNFLLSDMDTVECNRFTEMPLLMKILIIVGPLIYINILAMIIIYIIKYRKIRRDVS